MAITATDRGAGSDGNLVNSFNAATALTATLTAGNTGILAIAMDNAAGAGGNLAATSYTDNKGNIWYDELKVLVALLILTLKVQF